MAINDKQELLDQVEKYVAKLYEQFQKPYLLYHNLDHTKNVVKHTKKIAASYSLEPKFLFILTAAAWFHDCGHLFGPPAGHEERSNLIMREYLTGIKIEEDIIRLIEQSISVTRFPYEPLSLLDEILCDADSYHFGTEEFLVTDELVKEEYRLRNNYLPVNWDKKTLSLLEDHHFFTPYCKSLLKNGKQKNINILQSRIKD